MDKKVLWIIVAIVFMISGSVVFLRTSSSNKTEIDKMRASNNQTAEEITTTEQSSSNDQPAASTAPQGSYIEYSSTALASNPGIKLLFFHAPWCPQCRALEADIKSKGVPAGVTIIKVDYDNNQALRQKYEVTLQTTVVRVNDDGEIVKKFVAYDSPTLQAVRANLL